MLLSPHTKAMQDRATLDDYYLSFVGNNLETLFQLLFPQLESTPESEKHIHSNQVDQLGFLVSFGIEKDEPLSTVYKLWRVDTHGNKFETANRICEFLKRSLGLSTDLYPALGFSLVENVSLHIGAQNGVNLRYQEYQFSCTVSDRFRSIPEANCDLKCFEIDHYTSIRFV